MCDATDKITSRSQSNHGGRQTVELLIIAIGILAGVLCAATTYAARMYYKRLKQAQKEYEKARDFVGDIVFSFNRELQREAERIEAVNFKIEGAASIAENGLKKVESIENRVVPLETQVNQFNTQIAAVSAATEDTVKILSTLSASDAKVQELQATQENLKNKIAELEEQLQRRPIPAEDGTEHVVPTQVIPIRRDKAIAALTETEIAVLEFLADQGPKTAPEIKEEVQLSREHTARLMKKLYETGYLERETGKLPFKYSVKKEMEALLKKQETPASSQGTQ